MQPSGRESSVQHAGSGDHIVVEQTASIPPDGKLVEGSCRAVDPNMSITIGVTDARQHQTG